MIAVHGYPRRLGAIALAALLAACGDETAAPVDVTTVPPQTRPAHLVGNWGALAADGIALPLAIATPYAPHWTRTVTWDSLTLRADGRYLHRTGIEERSTLGELVAGSTADRGNWSAIGDTITLASEVRVAPIVGRVDAAGLLHLPHDVLLEDAVPAMGFVLRKPTSLR